MEARIKMEMEGKKTSEIVELNLDGVSGETLVGVTEEFTALESLSLNNCNLATLKAFPKLTNLKNLELGDNKIKDGLEALACLESLVFLNLADNPIQSVETLKPLGKISTLVELDLFSVDISIGKGKREKIFKFIPSLVYLDGCDKDDKPKEDCEEEEDEENGKYDDLDSEEEDIEDEELDEEDDDEEDVSLKDLYNKSLNDTEEDDGDFEGAEGEEDDLDDELEEEEEDDVKNLSKESVDEPRKKKQKVENGKETEK